MDPALFSNSDSLLLIGEGNFSFTRGLVELNLPVDITATCFESIKDLQVESIKNKNITFLSQKGVRVLSEVDGTLLSEHPILGNERFSKILFNFPHAGGKMKIHLNRILLKNFFRSVPSILKTDGRVFITLCKGQGGTEADSSLRRWEDSWQVVEMAAQSDFILSAVEPFRIDLVPNYTSVGYRSRDLAFHTDSALVHIFKKVGPLYPNPSLSGLLNFIEYQTLETSNGNIMCPSFYVRKYKNDTIYQEGSPISTLFKSFQTALNNSENDGDLFKVKYISDNDVPVYVKHLEGSFFCSFENSEIKCNLRGSLLDVLVKVFPLWRKDQESIVVFPGLVFNRLGKNFDSAPVSNHVLLMGPNVSTMTANYINAILPSTGINSLCSKLMQDSIVPSSDSCIEVVRTCDVIISVYQTEVIVGQEFSVRLYQSNQFVEVPVSLIYMDKLAKAVFCIQNWRELWAEGARVDKSEGELTFRPSSLYHRVFTFDICFSNSGMYREEKFYEVLWQLGGDIITNISPSFNDFDSGKGWQSRCYRLSYQSYDRALCKSKARDIHLIIGSTLCTKLGMKMH